MRAAIVGMMVCVAILSAMVGAGWQRNEVYAQTDAPFDKSAAQSGELIALTGPLAEGRQQITLIDPRQRSMSVYHIDAVTGKISLRSTRNIRWDLLMDEYNGERPSPQEIRSLIQIR